MRLDVQDESSECWVADDEPSGGLIERTVTWQCVGGTTKHSSTTLVSVPLPEVQLALPGANDDLAAYAGAVVAYATVQVCPRCGLRVDE